MWTDYLPVVAAVVAAVGAVAQTVWILNLRTTVQDQREELKYYHAVASTRIALDIGPHRAVDCTAGQAYMIACFGGQEAGRSQPSWALDYDGGRIPIALLFEAPSETRRNTSRTDDPGVSMIGP